MNKIDLIQRMIDADPKNGSAYFLLADEYAATGNVPKAVDAYSSALKYGNDEMREQVKVALDAIISEEEKTTCLNEKKTKDEQKVKSEQETKIVNLNVIKGSGDGSLSQGENKMEFIDFNDVGGLEDLKKTIEMKIVKPFTNRGLFQRYKKKAGGGILLYGPPGCGKTFIARATAGQCQARFQAVHIADILSPYVGVSSQNIRDIFATARHQKPCVLFFDELDTLGYNRSKLSSEHMRPVVDQLLTEIDGIDGGTGELLLVAATNTPWDVDTAFKRPGRFDKMIFVAPPDKVAREAIFRLKCQGRPMGQEIHYQVLAEKTELFSGADIECVVEVATEMVLEEIMMTEQERSIEMEDLLKAISIHEPTTLEWLHTIRNYVKYSNQAGLYSDVEKYLRKYKMFFR